MFKVRACMVVGLVLFIGANLSAVIVTFDDLPRPNTGGSGGGNPVPADYGDIYWEWDGLSGPHYMSELDRPDYGQPVSGTQYMYNFSGDTMTEPIAFSFHDVDARLTGAYLNRAAQDQPNPIEHVRFVGYNAASEVIATSAWLALTDIPTWLAAGAAFQQSAIARITIDRDMTGYGKFGVDNLTYDIIPEPATLLLLTLGSAVLTRKRRVN